MMIPREQQCSYWGTNVEPEHRASWWYGWGRCGAQSTVFVNGKGYCEKHSNEAATKHKKPHGKDTRARRAPVMPDVEDKFIDKPVDRW